SANDNSNSNNNNIKQTRKDWDLIGPDGEKLIKKYNVHKYGGDDYSDESSLSLPSFTTDDDNYDDDYDEKDLFDSLDTLVILFCCFFLAWLVYFRQLRNQ